jgi:hypothetical protein
MTKGTSNIQHPTPNAQWLMRAARLIGCWVLDVGCWMFPGKRLLQERATQRRIAGNAQLIAFHVN